MTTSPSSPVKLDEPDERESIRRLRYAAMANQSTVWEWRVQDRGVFRCAPELRSSGSRDAATPRWQKVTQWLDNIHPEDREKVALSLSAFEQKPRPRIRLQYRQTVGDEVRWFEVVGIVSHARPDGTVVQLLGTETDVTESRRTMRLLADAQQRAEDANRAKSEFVANMSHEVRTPLNAVIGLTRLLRGTELQPTQLEYLNMIDGSAKALLAILNDVLDLSKVESGNMVLEAIKFDLHDWIREAVEPYLPSMSAKHLKFELNIDRQVPRFIVGDPARLRQILANLIANAVRFTEKGMIVVQVVVDRDAKPKTGCVGLEISVQDTGVGIAPEAQERIFKAFTQADASTTRRYGGTGLGLAICRRLAAMFGGTLDVRSSLGAGSVFTFRAPFEIAADQNNVDTHPAELHGIGFHGSKVLVAEDHPINQLLVRQFLEQFSCQVTMVSDGRAAIDAWMKSTFDFVLMDIQMPIMGGDEAVQEIRRLEQQHARPRTIVIALTAHALTSERERYLALGMDGYVTKPMSPDALTAAIQTAMASAREAAERPTPEALSQLLSLDLQGG